MNNTKFEVINIDNIGGIRGIQQLLDDNPDWSLVTCGVTKQFNYGSEKYSTMNFAVFKTEKDVEFYKR